jgi:uridylate kinase
MLEVSRDYRVFIVVGGGETARRYITFARELGIKEELLDEIGIAATRLNAILISSILNANASIPSTTSEASSMKGKIIVMGGTIPGHSTDTVGAELAEMVSAERFIIATDVNGVYDRDPKRYRDARLFSTIDIDKLMAMCGTGWEMAGKSVIIDGPALEVIKRASFETIVVNGRNLENLKQAIYGRNFVGTRIKR